LQSTFHISKLTQQKGISVIIPNYNGRLLLPEILPALFEALSNVHLPCEIIITDDCSTDESIVFLQKNYPAIILLQNETNKGFSPTINKGIYASKYAFLLLLNSDVKLTKDYFISLLPYFDDDKTFGVMGRIIGWDDNKIQDGGKYPAIHGVKIKTSGNYIPIKSKVDERFYSFYLSGANALVSRKKIIELGGFNELFAPFYIEDVELCLRAWRLGWKCYYEHNAICRHQTSVTIKSMVSKNNIRKIYYRNKMFLHAIHLQKATLFLWHLQLVPEAFIHLVTGRFWYFKSLQQYFASQKVIQRSKKLFVELQTANSSVIALKDVITKIQRSLKQKEIGRF
jgi:GT2 family glycosyltransferase